MSTRRQAREFVLKALYSYEILERDVDVLIDELVAEKPLGEDHLAFARHYIEIAIKNFEFLDKEIVRLTKNWEIDRIAIIDKTILRMALCELNFMPDIPEKVAINEAIDLAKMYSTFESSSFVNGILDAAKAEHEDNH
ncbi:MAG: transcription antitermination factor NusB [candidate division Zixibacteria bacterium]|nr:transcription antitermination factor NusB [candidate division Zixibacteria bacterium]